jgi:D-alanyl-D-alanine carboxypeptidase
VGKPPLKYINTDHVAARGNIQVLGGKTGYNDVARYCLVIATKVDGRNYFMAFLANEGKLTRFGDVARVADWVIVHKPKTPTATPAPGTAIAANPAAAPAPAATNVSAAAVALPVGVAAPLEQEPAPGPEAATPPATATP